MSEHNDRILGGEPPAEHIHPGSIPAPAHPSTVESFDQALARRADHVRLLREVRQPVPLSTFNRPWLRADDGTWRGQLVGGVPL
jgi:hypothetical protein